MRHTWTTLFNQVTDQALQANRNDVATGISNNHKYLRCLQATNQKTQKAKDKVAVL